MGAHCKSRPVRPTGLLLVGTQRTSFTVDLNLTDGLTHSVALYCVDWENLNREQTIEILNASNGSILSSQALTAFNDGQYVVWDIKGHVTIRLTRTGPYNAALSGLFFDAPGTPPPSPPPAQATFIKKDTTTRGSWKGVYGAGGYNIINHAANYPSYATATPGRNSTTSGPAQPAMCARSKSRPVLPIG